MAMFNSKLLNYQRVFFILLRTPPKKNKDPHWGLLRGASFELQTVHFWVPKIYPILRP